MTTGAFLAVSLLPLVAAVAGLVYVNVQARRARRVSSWLTPADRAAEEEEIKRELQQW